MIKATHAFGVFLANSSSPLAKSKSRRSSRCRFPRSCPVTPPASGTIPKSVHATAANTADGANSPPYGESSKSSGFRTKQYGRAKPINAKRNAANPDCMTPARAMALAV